MNNILTLFHGYLGLLLDSKDLDKAALEGLARVKDGARAATELMERTHSLARPSTVVWREIHLNHLVRVLKPSLDALCGPETRITLDLPEMTPPVRADAIRLKNAVVEVVRNAIQATSAGGEVTIEVRSEPNPPGTRAEKPLHWVMLTVIDTGPGIPSHLGDRIFQPFFSTKKMENAVGLGLTVALDFVQQLGGMLRYQSEPGRTQFQMRLPSQAEIATLENFGASAGAESCAIAV